MTCTFFGHKDTPWSVEPVLKEILTDLIKKQGVKNFLVGHHGNFDKMVLKTLKELKKEYAQIKIEVVLAYLTDSEVDCLTIYPEGLESVPKRYAISARNEWMTEKSQIVVTYVNRVFGGAAQFKELAKKKGKKIIELSEVGCGV